MNKPAAPTALVLFDEGSTATLPTVCASVSLRPEADRQSITELKTDFSFGPGLRELPTADRFRSIGFHYTEDAADTRDAFVRLLSKRGPKWFTSITRVGANPKETTANLKGQFTWLTALVLDRYREYDLTLCYEQNNAIDFPAIVEAAVEESRSRQRPARVLVKSKQDEPLLALADYTTAIVTAGLEQIAIDSTGEEVSLASLAKHFTIRRLHQILPACSCIAVMHEGKHQVVHGQRRHLQDSLSAVQRALVRNHQS